MALIGPGGKPYRKKKKKPQKPQRPQAARVNRERASGYTPPKPAARPPREPNVNPQRYKDLDPDLTPTITTNVRTLTDAFEAKFNRRPTSTQAFQMLSTIGNEELGPGDWGAFLAPAIASNSASAELMKYAHQYYRETGYFPNAAHMKIIMQSGGKVNFGDMATPRNDHVLADVLFNGALKDARTKERERAKKSNYRFSNKDIMKMPGGPKTLAGAMKARQLANRPMFTLGKTWDAEDPDERINQKDLDRINEVRTWYGMTTFKKKIEKNIIDRETIENAGSWMVNPDGSHNKEAAKVVSTLAGKDALIGLDTFVGLKDKAFHNKDIGKPAQRHVDAFGKRLMEIFPDMQGPGKDGHFLWNDNYDRFAALFLFNANLPDALLRNDFPEDSAEWKRIEKRKKLAQAGLSIATSGVIKPTDDIREWIENARFLGPVDSPAHFSDILDEYLFENCYLGTIAGMDTPLATAMAEYVTKYGGGRVESLPLKYRQQYQDIEAAAYASRKDARVKYGDSPLSVNFGMMFDEEVARLEKFNEIEYQRAMSDQPLREKHKGSFAEMNTQQVDDWVQKALDDERPPVVVGRGGGPVIDPRDPLSDSQMFYHTRIRPLVYNMVEKPLNAPYRWIQRIYLTAELMKAYSNGKYTTLAEVGFVGGPQAKVMRKVHEGVQENYGDYTPTVGALRGTKPVAGLGVAYYLDPRNLTIPLDPSAYTSEAISKAWNDANKAVSEHGSDAYMRYEFRQLGLDPDQHGGMLFFASLAHSLAFETVGDFGIGAAARGGTKLAARLARATIKPRLLQRVEIAQKTLAETKRVSLDSELATWQGRLDTATEALRRNPDWLEIEHERELAAANVDYLLKSIEDTKRVDGDKLIPVDIEDTIYGPDELAAIRVKDYYADAHLLERPLWYDTFAENLSNVTIDSARVQFLFGIKERHVPGGVVDGVSNKDEYNRLLRVIGESRDADEIQLAMNKLRSSFLLKVDPGALALGKLHHWNRIVRGESFGNITMVMPEGNIIKGGLEEVEEHLHEVWTLVNGGQGGKHSVSAMDRMWYYLQRLRDVGTKLDETGARVSANLPEATKRDMRLAIWHESQQEIVKALIGRKPSERLVRSIERWAKANGMKVDDEMLTKIRESEWAAYQAFQLIKGHKHVRIPIVKKRYKDLGEERWFDEIQSGDPFMLGSQKGAGQTGSDLVMHFNLQDLSHFQRGKSFSQMALNTNPGGWLPSWMGVVNASKTLAVASMSFPLSALFIDEIWRFVPEILGGRISLRAAARGYGRKELEAVGDRLTDASRTMVIAHASGNKEAISTAKKQLEKAQKEFREVSEYNRARSKGARLSGNSAAMELMQQNNPEYIPILPGTKNYHIFLSNLVRQYQDDLLYMEFTDFRRQLQLQLLEGRIKRRMSAGMSHDEAVAAATKEADEFVDNIDPQEFKALFRQHLIDRIVNNFEEGTEASLEAAGLRHSLKSTGRLTDDMLEEVDKVLARQEEYLRATSELDNTRIAIRQEREQAIEELQEWNAAPHVVPASEGFPVRQGYDAEVVQGAFADALAHIPKSQRKGGLAKALRDFKDNPNEFRWNNLRKEVLASLRSQRDALNKQLKELAKSAPTPAAAKQVDTSALQADLAKVERTIANLSAKDDKAVEAAEALAKERAGLAARINAIADPVNRGDAPMPQRAPTAAASTTNIESLKKQVATAQKELDELEKSAAPDAGTAPSATWGRVDGVHTLEVDGKKFTIVKERSKWHVKEDGRPMHNPLLGGKEDLREGWDVGFENLRFAKDAVEGRRKELAPAAKRETPTTPAAAPDLVTKDSIRAANAEALSLGRKHQATYYVYRNENGKYDVTTRMREGEATLNQPVTYSQVGGKKTKTAAEASKEALKERQIAKKQGLLDDLTQQLRDAEAGQTPGQIEMPEAPKGEVPAVKADRPEAPNLEDLNRQLAEVQEKADEILDALTEKNEQLSKANAEKERIQQAITKADEAPVDDGMTYEEMAELIDGADGYMWDELQASRAALKADPLNESLHNAHQVILRKRRENFAKKNELKLTQTYIRGRRDALNSAINKMPRTAPKRPPDRMTYVRPERVTTRGEARRRAMLSWKQLQQDPRGRMAIVERMKSQLPTIEGAGAVADAADPATQKAILDAVNDERLRMAGLLDDDPAKASPMDGYRDIRSRLDGLRDQRRVNEEQIEALGSFPRHQFLTDKGEEWIEESIDRLMLLHNQPELRDAILHQRDLTDYEVAEIRMRLGDMYGRNPAGDPLKDLPQVYGVKNSGTSWFSSPGSAPGNIPLVSRLAEITAYRLLNAMGNTTRKMAFYGNFNVELRRLMDAGYTMEDAAEAAMWRAKDYADSVMYKPGMTALESDLAGYMYFLPAYRQGTIYWGQQFLKHPLVYSHLASVGQEEFPVQYLGDYGAYIPLPLFMGGNLGEMAIPGLTAPLLAPLRIANSFTGWEYVNVSPNDTTTTSDDDMKWVYTGNTKMDWLSENRFLNPMTGFADKNASPTSWMDDFIYGYAGTIAPLEVDGDFGRILSSIAISMRKDPMARERASFNIMQEQIARGHAPDTDLFEARIKGQPGWYTLLTKLKAKHPEAVLGMLTRQLTLRKILYSPRSIGEIEPVEIEGEPGNLWNYIGMFRDDNARTLSEADWEYTQASGNPELQKRILEKYPRLKATKLFFKMTAEEKQDFLLKEKNHHLIPYITGKNMYGDGRPLNEWEFIHLRERGIIRRKDNADWLRSANILHATSNYTKQHKIIEDKKKSDLKAAKKYIYDLMKKDNLPAYTEAHRKRELEGYFEEYWGKENVSSDVNSDTKYAPPEWLPSLVRRKGAKGDYNKPSLWDPGAIRLNFDENEQAMKDDKSAEWAGAYTTLEDYYDNNIYKKAKLEDGGVGDFNRISGAFNDMLLPEDRKEFALNRSASINYIRERTKEEKEERERAIAKVVTSKSWELNSVEDIVNACPGIITPGSPNYVGSYDDFSDWLDLADKAFGAKKDAYAASKNKINPDTYSDAAEKAQDVYNKEMARLEKTPVGRFFSLGLPYRILNTSLADPGHGRKLNKEFISDVVKATGKDGDLTDVLPELPIAGYKDQKKNLSAHAWASIMLAAEKEKRKIDNERKYRPDDGHIGDVERKAGTRLTRLVEHWMKRPLSSRFKKEWEKYYGYSILTSYFGGDY
jgi:hypothetical protein